MNIYELEMYHNLTSDSKQQKKYYLIYARKSTESEDNQVQSIDDQLKAAEQLRSRKNLQVVETFTESRSAKMPGRPHFNAMVDLIRQRGGIKGIIVWKLNRLSRNPVDEGTIRWLLQSGEIDEIVTPDKTYTQVDSDFIMAIEGAQAQRFINDLKKDSARGVQSKIEKGVAPMLAPPGYRNAVEKKQGERDIQPHPIYFPLMRKVFELALTGHYSTEALYKKVEELGIKNSRNQIVSRTQLYKILKDPFYTGTRYVYAGRLYTNGVHKPMISDEEFDLLQELLSKRARVRTATNEGFLNGIIRCGECNMMVTCETHRKKYKNGKTQTFVYYRCTKKRGEAKCSQPYLPASELEKQAMDYLASINLSTRFVEWGIKWLNVMHQQQTELKNARLTATQQAYNEIDSKIDRLVDLMISGVVNEKEGAIKKQRLEEEKTRLFSILSKIDNHATEWTNLTMQTFDFVKTAQEKFTHGTIEQQKTILKVIGSNLMLRDRKLTIQLRKPFEYIQKVAAEMKENNVRLLEIEQVNNLSTISAQEAFLGSNNTVWGE